MKIRRGFTEIEYLCAVIVAVILVVIVIDCCGTTEPAGKFPVIERSHTSHSVSVGTGYDYGKDGGPVIVTTDNPEKWTLIVACDGAAISVDTDSATWAAHERGTEVFLYKFTSRIFGRVSYQTTK